MWRNRLEASIYKAIVRPVMFKMSPEAIHDQMIIFGSLCSSFPVARWCLRGFFNYQNTSLSQEISGINFRNPIGLAAGFDKNGKIARVLPEIGLAYGEFGSITLNAHVGNPRPWMHRLTDHGSIVVHYGLKNDGAKTVVDRLSRSKTHLKNFPVGISVAAASPPHEKSRDEVITDVVEALDLASKAADYLTINISCPNIYNAPDFLNPDNLDLLLKAVDMKKISLPILLKISPDLSGEELKSIVTVAKKHKIAGFVAGNLTKDRESVAKGVNIPIPGGLSGKLTRDKSDELIEKLYRLVRGEMIIVGCGGIFTAEDAYKKIGLGASLLQMITGMIYEGPEVVAEINWGITQFLKRDGYDNISQAVGRLIK